MRLVDIRTAVIARRGVTVNNEAALLNEAINTAYEFALAYHQWPWLRQHGYLQVYPAHTGEFTTVNDNPTFTSTDAVTPEWDDARYEGGWAYSEDRGELFPINTTVVGPPSTATADFNWIAAGGNFNFTFFRDIYPLPVEVAEVLTMSTVHTGTRGYKLIRVHDDEIERMVVNRMYPSDSNLMYWSADGLYHDTDNHEILPRVRLWPQPSEEFHLPYVYLRQPPELAADNDVPFWPEKHHRVLVVGALEALSMDDGVAAEGLQPKMLKFAAALESMKVSLPQVTAPRDFIRWDRRRPQTLSPDNWWGMINV